MNKIRLLWVEDAAADRVLYRELLSAGDSNDGWLERIEIEDATSPPPEIGAYAAYDGVARVRLRLFARPTTACPMVPPHLRDRFL